MFSLFLNNDFECSDRKSNGVAIWVDWNFGDNRRNTITTGPLVSPEIGENIMWDYYTRQGVHLFPNRVGGEISYKFNFDYAHGNISFVCT